MPDSTLEKHDSEPDVQTSKSCPHTSLYGYSRSGIKEVGCLSRGRTETLRENIWGFEE